MTSKHIVKKMISEIMYYPEHDKRHETEEYRKSREELVSKYGCYVCGTKEDLEAHHYGCEYSEWNACSADKLKDFLMTFDVYGYSATLKDKPIESVDDIRNLMVLCSRHHRHKRHGIHAMTFPFWIMQYVKKDSFHLIPKK